MILPYRTAPNRAVTKGSGLPVLLLLKRHPIGSSNRSHQRVTK
jgi:hypothetical protein